MKKRCDIISVDGLKGVGKSTQINVLRNHFNNLGIKTLVNRFDGTVDNALEIADNINEFLSENPDGVVLNDGSIARMIQLDIQNGLHDSFLVEKYRSVIFEYQKIHLKYGMVNIILLIDDIDSCNCRTIKKQKMFGENNPTGIEDLNTEIDLDKGFRIFDTRTITKTINFQVFETNSEDSIVEVMEDILKLSGKKFAIKKPSFEG